MSKNLKQLDRNRKPVKRKQMIGFLVDVALIVDLVLLALSGLVLSGCLFSASSGSNWWLVHEITACLFVVLAVFHLLLHFKMIKAVIKIHEPYSKKQKVLFCVYGLVIILVICVVTFVGAYVGEHTDAITSATATQNRNDSITEGVTPTLGSDSSLNGIFSRTTTRVYSSQAVDQDLIDTIIQAAFASPSGGGQYANEYIVVNDKSIMKKMMKSNPYAQALETAPIVIVIAGNTNTAYYEDLLMFDAGIAAQSIMIEASELGLSTVPMSIAPSDERMKGVADALNLPDGVEAEMMVAIGYPYLDAYTSASVNYYNQGEVHYNSY